MLEIGESSNKGNKDEIRLEEDSATLEAVLPYFYSNSIGVIKVTDFAFILKMINCGDKYQVSLVGLSIVAVRLMSPLPD